jgi:hypothetical protein
MSEADVGPERRGPDPRVVVVTGGGVPFAQDIVAGPSID